MSRPTLSDIAEMSDNKLMYLLIADTSNAQCYRLALLSRMILPERSPLLAAIDAEKNQHQQPPQPSPHPSQPAPPPPQPAPPPPTPQPSTPPQQRVAYPFGVHWETDKALEKEQRFQMAVQSLLNTVQNYWESRTEKLLKTPVEMESFLESLLKHKKFEELSENQQKLLGMARRFHSVWTRRILASQLATA